MNVAKFGLFSGALALSMGSIVNSASAENVCASCQLQARQQAQSSVSLGDLELQAHTLLGFAAQDTSGIQINWSGKGELPGSFHPKQGEYNPSFSTPFWTVTGGFVDAPSAPWNQFVPANYGHYFFNQGLRLAGPFSPAPFAPIWN